MSFVKNIKFDKKEKYISKLPPTKKQFVDESMQNLLNNCIMEGYFPKENVVKDMAIKKVNNTLFLVLGLFVFLSIISYYFVISYEIRLNELSKETVILNNENEELQNKLDSLKSFNNVDKTLQENNMLQRAGIVIETPEVIIESPQKIKKANAKIFSSAIGF